jgi:hypothetical protein
MICLFAGAPTTQAETVQLQAFFDDFDGGQIVYDGVQGTFSGVAQTEPVYGYSGIGTNYNIFSGVLIRNDTGHQVPPPYNTRPYETPIHTILTLTGLPDHESVDINFLLAINDSWDGDLVNISGEWAGPDYFAVEVDGIKIFEETFDNFHPQLNVNGFQVRDPSYTPPVGVQLAPASVNVPFPNLGWDAWGESAFNMGLDPDFDNIPHTGSTLTIEWYAHGSGWQGGLDESWGIENVQVILNIQQDADLVGYWNFDEGEGTVLNDKTNNDNDGTIYGATWTEGVCGSALDFDGMDDYVELPDIDLVPNPFTICVWINVQDNSTSTKSHIILGRTHGNIPGEYIFQLGGTGIPYSPYFNVIYESGTGFEGKWTNESSPEGWHFYCASWDSVARCDNFGEGISLYIDGVLQTNVTEVGSCSLAPQTGQPLTAIGVYQGRPELSGFAQDPMDEIRIYERVLNADEIGILYAEGLSCFNQHPVADPNGPYLCATKVPCAFDGSASHDLDGHSLTYVWDFGDSNTGNGVTPTHTYAAPGIYDVCLTVNDGYVDSEQVCTLAVIYDPDGGFVTGGGWIDSPEGAYSAGPSLTGKATFGFVSKYKKGADVPTGQTQFQFKVADLNFHSDTYQWLVVAGHQAKFKGTGTINGIGNYGFMLSAVDEKLTPSTDVDLFRIKIWDMDDGDALVYDNEIGIGDDVEPTTEIGGGSIVIHQAK